MELDTEFSNRFQELEQAVSGPLNQCGIEFTPSQIVEVFNTTLQNRKLEFIIKQNKDKELKQAKRSKFLARKESDNEIATLSTRQVKKLHSEITELKKNLQKLKVNNSSKSKSKPNDKNNNKRSKNVNGGQTKPTGQKKKRSGRKLPISRSN